MDIPTLKDANFFSFIAEATTPVVVTFVTKTSKPASEQLATIVDLAESYEGVISFAIVDAEDSLQAADHCGILSVPTSVLFKGGKFADRIVGLMSKTALVNRLEEDLRSLI
ncbi:thioredoxin family protein [bacterium]|nr:thioredoxin family protein [bacterium]